MMEEIVHRLFKRRKEKRFSAWQIELTTRCPLQCSMCVRTGCNDWHNEDMPFEQFKKLLPYLKDVETVVLEGWGESLLHGNILECVRLAKAAGPEVGFVTSGMGLTRERASGLIDAGIDFMGFSLAGVTPEVHDRIRKNSSLVEILQAIRRLQEIKAARNLETPRLHIVFLMLHDNSAEIAGLPGLAESLDVKEIVLLNIIQVTSRLQDEQKVFSCGPGKGPYEELIQRAVDEAGKRGIKLRRASGSAIEVPVCDENPLRNLYISCTGEVSPCVYLFPPAGTPFTRIFCGQEFLQDRVTFGNIFKESLSSIWESAGYVRFRELFLERQQFFRDRYLSLLNMTKLAELREVIAPPPPEPCRTCHKMLGV